MDLDTFFVSCERLIDSKLNDYEGIILPELSCIQICAIYNGIPIDELTKWSINTILNGKTVLVRDDVIELYSEAICKDSGLYTRVTNFLNELIKQCICFFFLTF